MLDSVVTREITFSSPKEMEDVTNAPPPLPPKTLKKRNGLGKPPAVEPPKIIGFQEVNRPVVKIPNGRNNDYVVNIHVKPAESDDVVQKQHPKIFSEESKGHLDGCIRICVSNGPEGVHMQQADMKDNPYFFYGPLACQNGKSSSGQSSPSDTLDSGTCSDLDGSTPPPLPKRKSTTVGAANGITVTVNGRRGSLTSIENTNSEDSDNESNISCDSLNSSDLSEVQEDGDEPKLLKDDKAALPQNLLQDIRERTKTLTTNDQPETYDVPIQKPKPNNVSTVPITSKSPLPIVEERTYEEKKASELKQEEDQQKSVETKRKAERSTSYETDRFYEFHMNENSVDPDGDGLEGDETFAGFKDIFDKDASSTIRSSKGTVRGVKNRVRAGIQTFLLNQAIKGFKEKEQGKVVVYTTTMGIVRGTYQKCLKVKQILRTLLIKFEERDVYMSKEVQEEIKERMHCEYILVPQVFMEGQHLGDAETIDRLNESGELRRILKPFKCPGSLTPCEVCGGYRLLPCTVCNGSKKSVHRNHFSAEFVALKCMNCDESGLIRCHAC